MTVISVTSQTSAQRGPSLLQTYSVGEVSVLKQGQTLYSSTALGALADCSVK